MDFLKYNFVLDWHVHWYLCTYVSLSDLSLQGGGDDNDDDDDNTVFGLFFYKTALWPALNM